MPVRQIPTAIAPGNLAGPRWHADGSGQGRRDRHARCVAARRPRTRQRDHGRLDGGDALENGADGAIQRRGHVHPADPDDRRSGGSRGAAGAARPLRRDADRARRRHPRRRGRPPWRVVLGWDVPAIGHAVHDRRIGGARSVAPRRTWPARTPPRRRRSTRPRPSAPQAIPSRWAFGPGPGGRGDRRSAWCSCGSVAGPLTPGSSRS